MAQDTINARGVAQRVAKRLGRPYDAKRVRAWVRDNIAAYDDDGYTQHAYSPALAKRIEDGIVARARQARPAAASAGRAKGAKGSTKRPSSAKRPTGTVSSAPQTESEA